MKIKFIPYVVFLHFFFLLPIAVLTQTSEEEYLYLTYGYKEQLLKGLDDKAGYHWIPVTEYRFQHEKKGISILGKTEGGIGQFIFEGLFRDGEDAPCAIIAIYKETESMEKREGAFIPIPHPRSGQDILAKAELYMDKDIKLKPELRMNYILALQKVAMQLAITCGKELTLRQP